MKEDSLLKRFVDAFVFLPGVGRKTAQRYVCHILDRDREGGMHFQEALKEALENLKHCEQCRMYSETPLCAVCLNSKRDHSKLCVVEMPGDLMAIEESTDYSGLYFVLHGKLSPLDNIGSDEIGLEMLEARLQEKTIKEVVLATSATVEGDVTALLISEMCNRFNVTSNMLARGVPVGGDIEHVDATTLSQAFEKRRSF